MKKLLDLVSVVLFLLLSPVILMTMPLVYLSLRLPDGVVDKKKPLTSEEKLKIATEALQAMVNSARDSGFGLKMADDALIKIRGE